jgi:NADH:ubiquinone oxidoreductase subunit D
MNVLKRTSYLESLFQYEHTRPLAVERLCNCEVSLRAQYIWVLFCEITQILNHLLALTTHAMGVKALTSFLWAFEEWENLWKFYERVEFKVGRFAHLALKTIYK